MARPSSKYPKHPQQTRPSQGPEASASGGPGASPLVYVALNHPHGIKFTLPGGRKVTINGNATHLRGREKGVLPVGRYGLTLAPAEDWAEIQRLYGAMDIFKKGLIFTQDRRDKALDQAEEQAETRHGREPIDPEAALTQEGSASEA
ncbi:MAG: hypothetical protein LBV21_01055 [Candidatus Adiutrix sp.]|nr:hypothetical protein [Candidatus Adiutrix sp.]